MKKIVIIGGGISGLSLAYLLMRKSPASDISVLEADSRPGGKIWTEKVNGFLCEKGPNGFLDNKPKTLELCKSLGIDPVRSNDNSKKRFIFLNKRLNPLPESPPAFIKSGLLSWKGKLRILLELVESKGPSDETVADFIKRRLGKEALDKLIDPMTSGIYAGDPYSMSITSCFPRIKELEQEYGSLIRALIKIQRQKKAERKKQRDSGVSVAPGGTLTSFYNGAQTITDVLAEHVGERLRLGVSVQSIAKDGDKFVVATGNDELLTDLVVIAAPAFAASQMVKGLDSDLSGLLTRIPYPHVSVVCFGYRKEEIGHPLDGFGFLVPFVEGRRILGTLWDSSIFPNRAEEGFALLRTMVGGAKFPEIASLDDNSLIDLVYGELRPILDLKKEPDMVKVYRWDRAIPQYMLGHSRLLEEIDARLRSYPGLFLTGNAYRGIGINDCVENSFRLAEDILHNFTSI